MYPIPVREARRDHIVWERSEHRVMKTLAKILRVRKIQTCFSRELIRNSNPVHENIDTCYTALYNCTHTIFV